MMELRSDAAWRSDGTNLRIGYQATGRLEQKKAIRPRLREQRLPKWVYISARLNGHHSGQGRR
jgi:hypothetical protein